MFLVIFCQHFTKYCNIFVFNIFVINIFWMASSNIFQKCWFRQLFFINILQNVAIFFRYVGTFFLKKTYISRRVTSRSTASARGRGGRPWRSSTRAARGCSRSSVPQPWTAARGARPARGGGARSSDWDHERRAVGGALADARGATGGARGRGWGRGGGLKLLESGGRWTRVDVVGLLMGSKMRKEKSSRRYIEFVACKVVRFAAAISMDFVCIIVWVSRLLQAQLLFALLLLSIKERVSRYVTYMNQFTILTNTMTCRLLTETPPLCDDRRSILENNVYWFFYCIMYTQFLQAAAPFEMSMA
jgi:hypothetical protein